MGPRWDGVWGKFGQKSSDEDSAADNDGHNSDTFTEITMNNSSLILVISVVKKKH